MSWWLLRRPRKTADKKTWDSVENYFPAQMPDFLKKPGFSKAMSETNGSTLSKAAHNAGLYIAYYR